MPINAKRLIRKMRGGAQAHLLECDDGHFYVVKFRNNPQHRRILVNEWFASVFLDYLQISTPATAIVNLAGNFLAENPEIHIQLGSRRLAVESGWHFGSRYPGDPAKVMVYDFIPDLLLDKIVNRLRREVESRDDRHDDSSRLLRAQHVLEMHAIERRLAQAEHERAALFEADVSGAGE